MSAPPAVGARPVRLRVVVDAGRVERFRGEMPSDLLETLRELVADYPGCRGTVVLRSVPGGEARVDFRGRFDEGFEQQVRNVWGLKSQGYSLPTRLGGKNGPG